MVTPTALINCPQCKEPRAECWAMFALTKAKTITEDAAIRFIAFLAISRKKPCDLFANITVDLSQRDLAKEIGITGPGAGKLLKQLCKRGILVCTNKRKEYQTDSFSYELEGTSLGTFVCTQRNSYNSYSKYIYLKNYGSYINNISNKVITCMQTSGSISPGINYSMLSEVLRHEVSSKSVGNKKILTHDSIRILLLLKSIAMASKCTIMELTGFSSKRVGKALRILVRARMIVGDNNGFQLRLANIKQMLDELKRELPNSNFAEIKRKKIQEQQNKYRKFAVKIGVLEKSELPKVTIS
jgi:DNA-binding MarR family transcriptional regulator